MSRICAIIQKLESTEFVVDFVTTAGAMGTDDEDDDERKGENGKVKTIHPLRRFALYPASQWELRPSEGTE